jgi:uncharacterized RDD family membrane protein YckC
MEYNEILDSKVVEHDQKVESNHLASSGKRFGNYIIDLIIMYILIIIVFIIIFAGTGDANIGKPLLYLVAIIVQICYYTILESATGKSIGKMITKTKVTNGDFSRPSVGSIFKRSLCRLIPFEAFSFLGSSSPAGWHDTITETWVIDENTI